MLQGLNVSSLTEGTAKHLKTYHDCIELLVCNKPTSDCYVGECTNCYSGKREIFNIPNKINLSDHLQTCIDEHDIDNVQFYAANWTETAMMQLWILPIDDFVDELMEKLIKLKAHDYIAKPSNNTQSTMKRAKQI